MARKSGGRTGMLLLFIVIGTIIGSLLTKLMGDMAPVMTRSITLLNLPASTVNLGMIQIVLGMNIGLNLIGVIGIVLGILLYRLV